MHIYIPYEARAVILHEKSVHPLLLYESDINSILGFPLFGITIALSIPSVPGFDATPYPDEKKDVPDHVQSIPSPE